MSVRPPRFILFFFNDTATTEIYTLSLHDALPICLFWWTRPTSIRKCFGRSNPWWWTSSCPRAWSAGDRKSTRLNSSHANISYAVFCLKKKHQYLVCRLLLVNNTLTSFLPVYPLLT